VTQETDTFTTVIQAFEQATSTTEGHGGGGTSPAAPSANPAAGIFNSTQGITLSSDTPGATIYYTTDGSDPAASTTRKQYTGQPITTPANVIKTLALLNGAYSTTKVFNYTLWADDPDAEITNLMLSVSSSRVVTVSGNTKSGSNREVTLRIIGPGGGIEYVDQTSSAANGSFNFSFSMTTATAGRYRVDLGSLNMTQPLSTSFYLE
jgi:hypothetical protein